MSPSPRLLHKLLLGTGNSTSAPRTVGDFFRQMIGAAPGQSAGQRITEQPFRTAGRALFTPVWDPFIRHKLPGTAKALRVGNTAAVVAPAGVGLATTADKLYRFPEQIANAVGLEDSDRERFLKRFDGERWNAFSSVLFPDNDPIAKVIRDSTVVDTLARTPENMVEFREAHPRLDLLRQLGWLTPSGALRNAAAEGVIRLAPRYNQTKYRNETLRQLLQTAVENPERATRGPVSRIVMNALTDARPQSPQARQLQTAAAWLPLLRWLPEKAQPTIRRLAPTIADALAPAIPDRDYIAWSETRGHELSSIVLNALTDARPQAPQASNSPIQAAQRAARAELLQQILQAGKDLVRYLTPESLRAVLPASWRAALPPAS